MAESKHTAYRFKLGMYLGELHLPFDEALATARDIGAEYIWFNRLPGEPKIAEMTDAQVDEMGERIARHGLKTFLITPEIPFKQIHLTDLKLETLEEHPTFRKELDALIHTIQIAARLGIGAVNVFTFAWPGEYSAGHPTWSMRWLTRGGVIADIDMEKLTKAFSPVLEQAERYDVDVVLSMMPWNYTNTTTNFRRLAERLGSKRVKVVWGPADNLKSGEWDVATAGFNNVRPYLHSLHLKDLRVIDGLNMNFEYCPLGEGDMDYLTVLRNLRDHQCDAVLSMATHFLPPSGSREEAMRINFANLKALISQVEAEAGGNALTRQRH